MAAEIRRDDARVWQALGKPPEAQSGSRDPVERNDRPAGAGTMLVHVESHAAIMGQRRMARG